MLAVPSGRRGEGSLLPVVAQGWLVVSLQGGLRCDQSDQVCCGGTRPVGVRRDAFFLINPRASVEEHGEDRRAPEPGIMQQVPTRLQALCLWVDRPVVVHSFGLVSLSGDRPC